MAEAADLEGVPKPGEVLLGKYRIERVLGSGGMGVVVAATHLSLGQTVAIKFLLADAARDPKNVTRFSREARAAARIQSDHVARVSDIGTLPSGAPYMVMEYLEGEDLAVTIEQRGAMPVETAVRFILEASEALAEAHAAGIVHRDLKPANLFLTTRADGSGRIKVLDFGISKIAVEPGSQMDNLTKTAALMGSPMYMAPEQMRSAKTADLRADIWAMGAILFELLTAHPPFAGSTLPQVCSRILTWPPEPLGELAPHVPEAVVAAVLRCLEKDPQARFQSLAELAEAIAPYGGGAAGRSAELIRRVTPEPTRAAMPQNPAAVLAATPAGAGPPYGPVAATPTKGSSRLVIALVTGVLLLAAIAMVLVLKLARKRDPGPNPDISTASSSGGQHGAAASAVPGQTAQLESPAPEAGVATAGSSSSSRDVPVLPPVAPRKPSVVAPPVRPPPPAKRPGDELFTTRAP